MGINLMLASACLLLLQSHVITAAPHQRRDSWFCDGNGADWTTDLWTGSDTADFLTHRIQWYAGMGGTWPADVSGVPRAIAQYGAGGETKDNAFNWGTGCTNIEGICDLSEGEIKVPACTGNEERAFGLWSMRNAANYAQLYYRSISDVFDTSALKVPSIATTFLGSDGSSDTLGPLSWFILAQGVIGATTSFIPVVGAVTGVGSAVLGVAVGFLAAVKEPALDPRFTTFADLSARLGDVKSNTQTAMSNHFNTLFRDTPPQGDLVAGQELLNLISSGAWANQDMAQLPYSKPDMIRLIQAGFISEAWNTQSVVLVKWSQGLLSDIHGTNIDPCYGAPFGNDEITRTALACENDRNFVAVRMLNPNGIGPWSVNGWDTETINSWNLNHKVIIDTSEHRQGISGNWIDRGVDVLISDFNNFASNTPDNIVDQILPFNLPICELDHIDGIESDSKQCFGIPELCLADIISKNCPRLLLNNVPFPYDH